MMRSLFSGVSGLKAHQTGMDVIGNNIANVNTTGFKASRTTFADMFSQTLTAAAGPSNNGNVGGTNPKQIGLGSVVSSVDLLFTDGSTQSTGKNTDMALQGNGLFIVKQGKQTYYTRNGDFQFDQAGNFVNSAGLYVQGWTAKDGVVNTGDQPGNIQLLTDKGMPPKVTSQVTYTSNLNSAAPKITSMSVLDGNGNTLKVTSTGKSWSVGEPTVAGEITQETVSFAGNITIDSAKGQYSMSHNYGVHGNRLISVTLDDGDVVTNLPSTTTTLTDYAISNSLPTAISGIKGRAVTYADGSQIANSSNTYTVTLSNGNTVVSPKGAYATDSALSSKVSELSSANGVTLANGDTLQGTNNISDFTITLSNGDVLTNGSSTYDYIMDSALTSDIKSVTGAKVTYAKGDSIASSKNSYKAKLSNGDTLNISSSSTTAYTTGSALDTALTVTGINGNTVTLSDGSTITTSNAGSYTLEKAVPALTVSSIAAGTATTVKSIAFNTVPTVDSITPATAQTIKSQARSAVITVTLSNGDTVNVPKTSTAQYTVGSPLDTTITTIDTTSVTSVSFKDGASISDSNSTYTVTLNNGDTLKMSGTTASTYTKGSSISATNLGVAVKEVKGNMVTLDNGDTLTNNSGTTYKATLDNGDTLTISAASATDYKLGTLPATLSVKSIAGGLVHLSDGSTIKTTDTSRYTVGQNISANISAFTGLPTSTVASITADDAPTVTEFTGSILSDDGKTYDDFDVKTNGAYIKPASGLTVDGIKLKVGDDDDEVTVSSSDTGAYQIPGKDTPADVSTYTAPAIKSITLTMSDGSTVTETSGSYNIGYSMPIATTMKVFDKLGNEHNITLYFTKTKTGDGRTETGGNTWTVSVDPKGHAGSDTATITEDDASTTQIKMTPTDIIFNPSGTVETGSATQQTLTLLNGSESPMTLTIDFSQLTQYAAGSTITCTSDGNASGNLASVSIDEQGRIIGTYTNDVQQVEGQVAIAQFTNSAGLTKMGNSLYQKSNNSGNPKVGDNTTLGVTISTSSLEMSNVDVANEFSQMIITQRGFQSNSKIITVSDEMLETLINMKR